MTLIVRKYGGTSVGTVERIIRIAAMLARAKEQGEQSIVVLSAMGGATDRLLALAEEAAPGERGRELDALLASGEQVSTAILALTLRHRHNINAISLSGAQAGIKTDSTFNKARIQNIRADDIMAHVHTGHLPVIAGFQGTDPDGQTTTLGRGGSDTSAVAVAVATQADECRIYTDVAGVYTTDPRIVPEARLIKHITCEEMLEMAGLGAKVLQIRSVQFANKYNMPLRVLSTFEAGEGTLISNNETYDKNHDKNMEHAHIAGIAFNRDEAQLTITDVPDKPGIAAQILSVIAKADIEVDMIVQNVGVRDNLADFTFTVHRRDYRQALDILEKTANALGAQAFGNDDVVKVSLVGIGMRSHADVAATMFKALAENNINIHMISTSEVKISVVIDSDLNDLAVRVLHRAFALDKNTAASVRDTIDD